MKDPIFSVIIPVFNKWELTQNCLISLKKQTKIPYEVIVVDNASSDKTAELLVPFGESLFGDNFTRIRYEENRNYGPANNAGAKLARAPLLFFLNNDTLVTENWEIPLVEELNTYDSIGGVGPLLLYEDDTIQHVGVSWNLSFDSNHHLYLFFPKKHRVTSKKRQVQALTGAAFMMPKCLFFDLGCFNEEFRNGFEDTDLSLRIVNSGKKLYCLPNSVIYHLESQTPGRKKYDKENAVIFANCCKHLSITVDKHIHAIKDGFLPFLNNCFDIAVTLSDEEEKELTARYQAASYDVLYDVLQHNFYWRHGRSLLLNFFEERRAYEEASQLAYYSAFTFPTEENLKKAHELCLLSKQEKKAARVQEYMQKFMVYKSSPFLCKKMLRRIHEIGAAQEDTFLLQEIERTRERMGL